MSKLSYIFQYASSWTRIAVCGLALLLATPAAAEVEDFLGSWVIAGRDTSGITRIDIFRAGQGLDVRVFGECQRQARGCDWGTAHGNIYTPDAGSIPFRDASAVTATFNAGFSQKFVVLHRPRGNLLDFDTYTNFTDRSRRSDYMTSGRVRRDRRGPVAGFPNANPTDRWQQQYGRAYSYNDDVYYQQCRQTTDPGGVIAGALIGGLLGGIISDGRPAPTVAGIVLGGAAGAAMTQGLDCEDRSYAYRSYYDGLNAGIPNRSYEWRNPRSNRSGAFRVGQYYDDPYGFRCAPYSQSIYVNGRLQEAQGTACRQPDGTWSIVE